MSSKFWKKITFFILSLALGTLLAFYFFEFLDVAVKYQRAHQFVVKTESLALMIKNFQKKHMNYEGLNIDAFKEKEFPQRLYRHNNNKDFESIDGGRIQIYGASTSRYDNNSNAFVISWRDINRFDCAYLAEASWRDLPGLRFVGMTIDSKPTQYDEEELYNGCPGGIGSRNGLVACRNGKTLSVPLNKRTAEEACKCAADYCWVSLKYM